MRDDVEKAADLGLKGAGFLRALRARFLGGFLRHGAAEIAVVKTAAHMWPEPPPRNPIETL